MQFRDGYEDHPEILEHLSQILGLVGDLQLFFRTSGDNELKQYSIPGWPEEVFVFLADIGGFILDIVYEKHS